MPQRAPWPSKLAETSPSNGGHHLSHSPLQRAHSQRLGVPAPLLLPSLRPAFLHTPQAGANSGPGVHCSHRHCIPAPAGVDLLPDWPHGAALCSLHLPAVCRLPGPAHLLRPGDGRADEDPALRDHLLLRWSPGSSDVVLLGPWARPEEEGGVAESTTVSSQTASRTSSRIYSVL